MLHCPSSEVVSMEMLIISLIYDCPAVEMLYKAVINMCTVDSDSKRYLFCHTIH